ncbi:MAG: hypothetical protein GYA51_01275 [Candidatus Methanofastidiosa archaeon]|jgi:hypothetical protein|nr:hypothetical protein [Candidatus Methanofastidiosa archaeon]
MNAKEHIETWEKIQELRVALEDIVKKKMEQINEQNFESAAACRDKEKDILDMLDSFGLVTEEEFEKHSYKYHESNKNK